MSGSEHELFEHARARIGTVLRGKYRLDGVLGVGGMSIVYSATHRNKKRFAVKILHRELSLRPEIRSRFLREGYAANSVEHPGAVAVLDDDVDDDGAAFLVMELLDGESADDLWQRSGERVSLPIALSIAQQALEVLAAAHAHGVVHRDVKPANLFLTRRGEVKLLDFGVARVRDAATSQGTMSGAVMGTAGFMAPEQALGKMDEIDARTDIWAVGATVLFLVSGRCAHEGETAQETVVLAATRPAPSLESLVPDAPRPVAETIDRALAFDREARWPSALAMRDALRDASVLAFGSVSSLPPPPDRLSAVEPRPPGPPFQVPSTPISSSIPVAPVRRRRAAVLVASIAGAACLVLLLAHLHGTPAEPPAAATSAPMPSASAAVVEAPPSSLPAPPPDPASSSAPAVQPAPASASSHPSRTPSPVRPPPVAPAPSAKARCNPPYYYDGLGNRVFKRECL
jgi:serine/threonine-protein kinase